MEALLDLLGNFIIDIFRPAVDLVHQQVIERLGEPAYLSGFVWGVILAGLTGFLARQLAYYYGKVQGFLAPTKEPVMKDGPSQYAKAVSTTREFAAAVRGFLIVVFLTVCLMAVVYLAIVPSAR